MSEARSISVDSLKPGDRLGQDIMAGSQVLLRRGTALTSQQIERILRMALRNVKIEDAPEEAAPAFPAEAGAALKSEAVSPARSAAAFATFCQTVNLDSPSWMSSEHFARSVPRPKQLSAEESLFAQRKTRLRSEAQLTPLISPELDRSLSKALHACFINSAMKSRIDLPRLSEVSATLRQCLKDNAGGYIEFNDIENYGSGLASRSLLSAKLFGQMNGIGHEELGEYLSGQLAFSNAFCLLPGRLSKRMEELSRAEKLELGRTLKEFHDWLRVERYAPDERLDTLLMQFERYDGSGIPYGLSEDEIPPLSMRWAITWRYSSAVQSEPGRPRVSCREAADELIQNSGRGFSSSEVNNFIRKIGMFPRGSMVVLNDDRMAIVKRQNERALLKPVVELVSPQGTVQGELDLATQPKVFIRRQVLEY